MHFDVAHADSAEWTNALYAAMRHCAWKDWLESEPHRDEPVCVVSDPGYCLTLSCTTIWKYAVVSG